METPAAKLSKVWNRAAENLEEDGLALESLRQAVIIEVAAEAIADAALSLPKAAEAAGNLSKDRGVQLVLQIEEK